MTKWCNNCEAKKDSWSDKNYSGYKYHVRCWSCDKWSLVYDSDKNLYDWWGNGIDGEQKDVIKEFGVDVSSSSKKRYDKWDLLKLWYWARILEKNRWDIGISGKIQQMNFFSADWNNNLIAIINGEGSYGVNLLVYEMPMQSTGNPSSGDLEKFYIDGGYSYLSSAKDKVKELEKTLKGDNPILYRNSITVDYYDYGSSNYPMNFRGDVVKRIELPSDARYNPDKYVKPLDIVLVVNRKMVHACIYLGDKNVCHVLGEGGGRVKIDSWSKFLSVIQSEKILRYHPVIAFKKPDVLIKHIAKSIEGTSNYFSAGTKRVSDDGSFSLYKGRENSSNNCENFTNVCVLGINFSELAARKKGNSDATFNTQSSVNETTSKIDGLTSYTGNRISEIEGYKNKGNENRISKKVDREGIEMQNCIEVQPKGSYRLNSPVVFFNSSPTGCPIS